MITHLSIPRSRGRCVAVSGSTLVAIAVFLAALPLQVAKGESPASSTYTDSRGVEVRLPLGDLSFADRVVDFAMGDPASDDPNAVTAGTTLATPDYEEGTATYLTLGCRGELMLAFEDNVLVDVPGDDLHVFEVGPDVEATALAVSRDGTDWLEVGRISGGTASVDIGPVTAPGDAYRYVRITDLGTACGSRWPGADIDAVAAVGSAIRMTMRSTVLFDFDRDELKPEAAEDLQKVASKIEDFPSARVVVQGHTDALGSTAYNRDLSERRADSVARYLQDSLAGRGYELQSVGFGESQPVASNETEVGRQRNRRVDIVIVPVYAP